MRGWKRLGVVALGLACGHFGALLPGLALGVVGALGHGDRRVLALLFCLGCLRGASHSMASEPSFPRDGLHLEFRVVGMLQMGRPCRVLVTDDPTAEPLWLELEEGPCDLRSGQRILVERRGESARRRSDGRWALRRSRALLRRDSGKSPGDRLLAVFARQRQWAWERARTLDADALGAAAALGLRSALRPQRRKELRLAGLGHLLAVSGLHVGLVAWLVYRVLRAALGRSLLGLRLAFVFAALPVAAYVLATGASPSAQRAALMFGALSLGALWGRPVHPHFMLASVASTMLLFDPSVVSEHGFWLSFAAMLSILSARGLLMMQWRLAWGLAGLNYALFGYVSWVGSLLNLIAVPVFSVAVLPWALLGWGAPHDVGAWARTAARPGAQLVLDLAALGARVDPWGREALAWIAVLGVVMWGLFAVWGSQRLKRWRPPAWALLALVSALAWGQAKGTRASRCLRPQLEWGVVDLRAGDWGWCDAGARWDHEHSRVELGRRAWFGLPADERRRIQAAHPSSARIGLEALGVCAREQRRDDDC